MFGFLLGIGIGSPALGYSVDVLGIIDLAGSGRWFSLSWGRH